jgi:two-component system, LytTR family, sensor kinase
MEQKFRTKALFVVTTFISLAAGFLAFAIEMVTQFYFLKIVPHLFILTDLIFALIIAGVVFMISLVNMRLITFIDSRTEKKDRNFRVRFLLSFAFSSIPLFMGYLLIRFFGNLVNLKINLHPGAASNIIPYQTSPFVFMILFFFILFFSNTLIFISLNYVITAYDKKNLELENAQLKIKNIEATYQQLKKQIHPHFLFNSLNTLNSLIKDNPKNAEIFLKRLSDFLRASIAAHNENMISLRNELKFCIDYLELQKVRFGEALQFTVNIPEDIKSRFVPVFSIQQLVENAIKHNALTVNSPLLIKVEYNNNRIIISNNIKVKNITEESTGVGLANLTERYKILSGDEVLISTDNGCFTVSIKILDNEDSNHRG